LPLGFDLCGVVLGLHALSSYISIDAKTVPPIIVICQGAISSPAMDFWGSGGCRLPSEVA
jgi:hypothetical protein